MRDLLLWRYLRSRPLPTDDELLPLVQALGRTKVAERLPFLGLLDPLLDHDDSWIRAAAVRVLSGAGGFPAWRRLVAALKDKDGDVRRAAVRALRCSTHLDPGQWVHALFHPDEAVRRCARAMGTPDGFPFIEGISDYRAPLDEAFPPDPCSDIDEVAPCSAEDYDRVVADYGADRLRAFKAFLERGTLNTPNWRWDIAVRVLDEGGAAEDVFPVLLQAAYAQQSYPLYLDRLGGDLLAVAAQAVTTLGEYAHEDHFCRLLEDVGWKDPEDGGPGSVLLTQAVDVGIRERARWLVAFDPAAQTRLGRIARAFAWGIQLGMLLTGRRFKIEILLGEQYGYTRLKENKLYINVRPILLEDRHAFRIVQGLIVHEYGHHLYHKGPEAEAIWDQADKEGLGRLLNLVADEHLERNLRQRSSRYGDALKLLCAYAFQHQMREVNVIDLLNHLKGRAEQILPNVSLGAARTLGKVVVNSGQVLRVLDEAGQSLFRFIRALRLGLGNRSKDPKVAQALALFRGRFRHSDMPKLLEIARKLREIFGEECDLLNTVCPDMMSPLNEADWLAGSGGKGIEDVQKAVQQALASAGSGGEGIGGRGKIPYNSRWFNNKPEEQFKVITRVEKLRHDPVRWADYARRVAKPARILRRYFQELGLGLKSERFRLQGKQFDRSRAKEVVLRGDPRMLIARRMERSTDLFMGVLIDCSGSMVGEKIEQARLFGALLAEAMRDQRGIDLRVFGFTDRAIYDAGNARQCAVHDLYALDGNNDAAALWHGYLTARASKRRAKLLVMISDGLPTECSIAALRGLVAWLTRRDYCCAQVAVQPLAEICFPHYVVVNYNDLVAGVHQFGKIVMRLVSQALGQK